MTRLAREIPTDPAHPMKDNEAYKINIHRLQKKRNKRRKGKSSSEKQIVFTVITKYITEFEAL